MTTITFFCEWDDDNLASLVVAEETLRKAVMDLRKAKYHIASEMLDEGDE